MDDEIQRDYAAGRPEEVEIASIYDGALRALGLELEPELIERVMELEQEGWLNSVHVGPEVVGTLEELRRRGLRLGLVSNAAYLPRLMKTQLAALGLQSFFEAVSFSSEVGVRKPHPQIYADALRKLRVEARRALFVGDRVKEDIQGPKTLGMRAVLTREWRQEDDPGVADFVIQRLGELPVVISRLAPGARYELQLTPNTNPGAPMWRQVVEADESGLAHLPWDGRRNARLRLRKIQGENR